MKNKISALMLFVPVILLSVFKLTIALPLDGIAAVVDKEVILLSELNEITRMSLVQDQNAPLDTALFNEKRKMVLDRVIDDRVLLARAKTDSIIVSDEEVKAILAQQIDDLAKRAGGSIEALDRELGARYGLSVAKLKKQYTKDIKENLLKQRFKEKLFQKVTATMEEVREFYKVYADSLPSEEASINLSHIAIYLNADKETEKKALTKIEAVREKLLKGEAFTKLAYDFSDDPSARDSGDLGYIKKGALGLPEFETAAFALAVGQVSAVVRTKAGLHLIQLVDKKDEEIRVRHIVATIVPSEALVKKTENLLDSLKNSLTDSVSFAIAAKQYSQDDNTKDKGGYLGWFTKEKLSTEYFGAVKDLKEGEICKPLKIENVFQILRVNKSMDKRKLNLVDDFAIIQRMAIGESVRKKLEKKLKEWRSDFYIEDHLLDLEK